MFEPGNCNTVIHNSYHRDVLLTVRTWAIIWCPHYSWVADLTGRGPNSDERGPNPAEKKRPVLSSYCACVAFCFTTYNHVASSQLSVKVWLSYEISTTNLQARSWGGYRGVSKSLSQGYGWEGRGGVAPKGTCPLWNCFKIRPNILNTGIPSRSTRTPPPPSKLASVSSVKGVAFIYGTIIIFLLHTCTCTGM